MKQLLSLLLIVLGFSNFVYAQNTKGIHLQAIARNQNGMTIPNKQITLRLSIISDTSNDTIEYQEIKSVTTNMLGLFFVELGADENGKVITIGDFEKIAWNKGDYFIHVEVDPNNSLSFVSAGIEKINYVPLALFADKANGLNSIVPVELGGTGVASQKELITLLNIDKVNNTPDSLKPISIATNIALNEKLKKSDTISLSNRINAIPKVDTAGLSNRINQKLNTIDTLKLSNRINLKLNTNDTLSLSNRINSISKIDTTSLSNRINLKLFSSDTVKLSNRINLKLNTTDTASLSSRINSISKIDTTSLSNRINLKLNTTDTASLSSRINSIPKIDTTSLSNRINLKLTAIDTLKLSNRINAKLNSTDTVLLFTKIGQKLNVTDTASLSSRINSIPKIDTASLSNRINNKISIGTLSYNDIINGLGYTPVKNNYGLFYDTSRQPTSVSTATPVKLAFLQLANKINITTNTSGNPTRITVTDAGIYHLNYNLQFIKSDAGADELNIWIRRNGSAYLNSNSVFTIQGGNLKNMFSGSYYIDLGTNDYIELFFSVKNVNSILTGSPSTTVTPSRPAIPSALISLHVIN